MSGMGRNGSLPRLGGNFFDGRGVDKSPIWREKPTPIHSGHRSPHAVSPYARGGTGAGATAGAGAGSGAAKGTSATTPTATPVTVTTATSSPVGRPLSRSKSDTAMTSPSSRLRRQSGKAKPRPWAGQFFNDEEPGLPPVRFYTESIDRETKTVHGPIGAAPFSDGPLKLVPNRDDGALFGATGGDYGAQFRYRPLLDRDEVEMDDHLAPRIPGQRRRKPRKQAMHTDYAPNDTLTLVDPLGSPHSLGVPSSPRVATGGDGDGDGDGDDGASTPPPEPVTAGPDFDFPPPSPRQPSPPPPPPPPSAPRPSSRHTTASHSSSRQPSVSWSSPTSRPGSRSSAGRPGSRKRRGMVKVSPRTPWAPVYRDQVWSMHHQEAITTMEDTELLTCITMLGTLVVAGRADGTISAWFPGRGERVAVGKPGHDGPVKFIFAVRSDRAVVSIGGSSLKVWDVDKWWCMATTDIAIRPDDSLPYVPSTTSVEGMASTMFLPANVRTPTAAGMAPPAQPTHTTATPPPAGAGSGVSASASGGSTVLLDGDSAVLRGAGGGPDDGGGLGPGPAPETDETGNPVTEKTYAALRQEALAAAADIEAAERDRKRRAEHTQDSDRKSTTAATDDDAESLLRGADSPVSAASRPALTDSVVLGREPSVTDSGAKIRGVPPHMIPLSERESSLLSSGGASVGGASSITARRDVSDTGINCAALLAVHGEFNIDGHHVGCGYGDGSIQLFSVFDWKFVERIPHAHDTAVTSMMQMPDGTLVTGAMDGRIRVWTREHFGTFQLQRTVLAHTEGVAALLYLNGRLVTGCNDGKIKTWSTTTWVREKTMSSMTRFVYVMAPCYLFFVSGGSDGILKTWDQVTAEAVGSHVAHIGCHTAGIVISNGVPITVGSDDRRIRTHDFTPWLISAIDCVDMFQVWKIVSGPMTNPVKSNRALRNLILHYDGKETSFVEHFLLLGFHMSEENLDLMRQARAHERFSFFAYLDTDQDGAITDQDLVNSLNIPLPAARVLLCRTLGIDPPHPNDRREYASPRLAAHNLYGMLARGPVGLKRLIACSGAHWMYYGRRKRGQGYRFFGLSTLACLVAPYLDLNDNLAVATVNHDCNAVSQLGLFWKTITVPPRTVNMDRFRSFARRAAYGRPLEGVLAAGREMCPFYCVRELRLRDCDVDNDMLIQMLRVCPLLQVLDLAHRKPIHDPHLAITPHIDDSVLVQMWKYVPFLTKLNLFNTPGINYLPTELVKLKNLREVSVAPAEVHTPPPEITRDGYKSIHPYLFDMKETGVSHFPYMKFVVSGAAREQMGSMLDALRHAYFWPFGGLPGRLPNDGSLVGSLLPCKNPGPDGIDARLEREFQEWKTGAAPPPVGLKKGGRDEDGRLVFPSPDDVDFELFVRSVEGEGAYARTTSRKLPSDRALYACVLNLADWAGDIRERVTKYMTAIHRVAERAKVVLIGTGADQVGTPQDTPGCRLSADERMADALRMVQVWDKMNYYNLQDSVVALRKKFQQRLLDVFSTSDPYQNFDITGKYMSKLARPDRPWEKEDFLMSAAAGGDSDDDVEVWQPTTVDEIRGELEACEAALETRPRIVGAIALGCYDGSAALYRLNRKFHIDDPDPPPGTPLDETGGPWTYLPPPSSEAGGGGGGGDDGGGGGDDGGGGGDDEGGRGGKVKATYIITGVRRLPPTAGAPAAMSEIHRLIATFYPVAISLVSKDWLALIKAVCIGKIMAPRVPTPPPTPPPPHVPNPRVFPFEEQNVYIRRHEAIANAQFDAWFTRQPKFSLIPEEPDGFQRAGAWPAGQDAPLVPPMVSFDHFCMAITNFTRGRIASRAVQYTFAKFLHNVGLAAYFDIEMHVGPDHPNRPSPFATRAKPVQTCGAPLINEDMSTRIVPSTGVLDNTVWLQPQYLHNALIRVLHPEVKFLRFGRRRGKDPKEDILTYNPDKAAQEKAADAGMAAESRTPAFAVSLGQAALHVPLDRFYELLRIDLLHSGRASLKARVLSVHRVLPPRGDGLIPTAHNEKALGGTLPKVNTRVTADLRVMALSGETWEAPKSFDISDGHVHDAPEDDLHKGLLFHVHVQLKDKYGRPYFNWVVYKRFREFWHLHTDHFEEVKPLPPELPDRPGKFTKDRHKSPTPMFVAEQVKELDQYVVAICNSDPVLSRHDAFLRLLELHRAVFEMTDRDRGIGDGTKRAALLSAHRINGGEGPAGEGGLGVDVLKELAQEGISIAVGEDALGHDASKMAASEEEEKAARERADRERPDLSPRPNNLDFHDGFKLVNSNLFLRTVGASTGADKGTGPPALVKGSRNFYHSVRGSRFFRQHVEEHEQRMKLRHYYLFHRMWRTMPLPLAEDLFARLWHTGVIEQWPLEQYEKKSGGAAAELLAMKDKAKKQSGGGGGATVGAGDSGGLAFRIVELDHAEVGTSA